MAWRLVYDLQRRQLRREKVFRGRTNPLHSLNDDQHIKRYQNYIMWLADKFGGDMEHGQWCNTALVVQLQVMPGRVIDWCVFVKCLRMITSVVHYTSQVVLCY